MPKSRKIAIGKEELEFLKESIADKFQTAFPQHRIRVTSYKPAYSVLASEINDQLKKNIGPDFLVSEGLLRDLFFNSQVKDSRETKEESPLSISLLDACYLYLSDGQYNRETFLKNKGLENHPQVDSPSYRKPRLVISRKYLAIGGIALVLALLCISIFWHREPVQEIAEPTTFFTADHQQLTNNGKVETAAISPDGKSFAFISNGPADSTTLYIQNIGGKIPRVLYRWKNLSSSPSEWKNGLKWSKDGTLLCFRIFALDHPQINLISRFGGSPTIVEDTSEKIRSVGPIFALSPNNSTLASTFSNSSSLVLFDIAEGTERKLPLKWSFDWINEIEWGPNGKHILVCTLEGSTYSLWEVGFPNGSCRKIISDSMMVISPRYSNDGNSIYYRRPSGDVSEVVELNKDLNSESTEWIEKVVYKGDFYGEISISDEGRELMFCRGPLYSNLWLGSLTGLNSIQNFTPITNGTLYLSNPRISPNGNLISYVQSQNGKSLICIYDRASKTKDILPVDTKWGGGELVWSPEGEFLAFVSEEKGEKHVSMVSIHSGKVKTFLNSHPGTNSHLVWAPDSLILYQMPEGDSMGFNFRFLDPESGNENLLLQKGTFGYLFDPMVNRELGMVAGHCNTSESGLWLFDLKEERKEFLLESAYPVKWAEDWRIIYAMVYSSQPSQLFKVDPFQKVILDTFDLPFEMVSDISISPNDSLVVLSIPEKSMDVWMIEKPE